MSAKRLHITARNEHGEVWSYEGTRPDIESWLEELDDSKQLTIIVTDDNSVDVGRKAAGEDKITWGAAPSA
jgi:hypothetical protein